VVPAVPPPPEPAPEPVVLDQMFTVQIEGALQPVYALFVEVDDSVLSGFRTRFAAAHQTAAVPKVQSA
jgi:hypothetical protein